MSDTRTNAGFDNISTFQKMHHWHVPGERSITVLTAGNLATTQAVISQLDEHSKAAQERQPSLLKQPSMFQVASLIGETLRKIVVNYSDGGQNTSSGFDATMIVGGQIKGGEPRLFLIYPQGNFIEASCDTPYFQIGETKYGRPILVRAYEPGMPFDEAMKLLLVSFDSTIKANLSVGPPFDFLIQKNDNYQASHRGRIYEDDVYFRQISNGWGTALKTAFSSLPNFKLSSH